MKKYVFRTSIILLSLIGFAWISSSMHSSYHNYTDPLENKKIDTKCALEFESLKVEDCDSALCLKELKDKCSK